MMVVRFTDEIKEFIANNVKGIGNIELTKLVNDKFNTNYSVEVVKGYKQRTKLSSGLTGRFEKGHIPANKGKIMPPEIYEKCKATMFKRGNKPKNLLDLGTERTEKGYMYVKVMMSDYPTCLQLNKSETSGTCWVPKHHKIWFEHNGKIPPKHKIIFLDGNRTNFDISNLACVSCNIHARMNQNHRYNNNKEITQAGIALEKLKEVYRSKTK